MHTEELYRKLYTIRAAEEAIIKYYPENEMKTPMHMSMGQEHIATGVCYALGDKAQVFSSYRSHAAYLARTDDVEGFFMELYGKDEGPAKGRAGSMHLASPDKGHIASSAIVGSLLPVAAGMALANKMQQSDKIPVVFFGDGATEEGVFWETINFVALKQLPVLLVCEDNGLAVHTNKSTRHGYNNLADILEKFNLTVFETSVTDVEKVANIASHAFDMLPIVLIFECFRYLEHVGIYEDFNSGYRCDSRYWKEKDPLVIQRQKLNHYIALQIEAEVQKRIESAITKAKQAEEPYCG